MDYYKLLGISHNASFSEIKTRYRLLSKQHHPDVGGNQQFMAQLNQAYTVLSDPFKRSSYDAARRRQRTQIATPTPRQPQPCPAPRPDASDFTRHRATRPTRRKLWWIFASGTASACLACVGLLALHSVSIAQPGASTEPANKPTPTLVVQSPDESPIYSATETLPSPATNAPAQQSVGSTLPQKDTVASEPTTDCSQKRFGSFAFKRCKNPEKSISCTGFDSQAQSKSCYEYKHQ